MIYQGMEIWKGPHGELRFLALEDEHTIESEQRPDWASNPDWQYVGETVIGLTADAGAEDSWFRVKKGLDRVT